MANFARYIKGDETIDYTPTSAVSAGQVVVVGDLVAVAKLDIPANTLGALHIEGVFDFPKGAGEIAAGATLYWDATNFQATASSTGNKLLGKAEVIALTGATTVRVVLQPWGTTTYNPLTNTIADPGASGAIPVTTSGNVDLVTAAAETRTLAAPSFKGQLLLLSMKTDGGDCVVTCATTVNQTGNNTITFNDAGDAVLLVAKTNGANIRWSVVSNDGAALSTV